MAPIFNENSLGRFYLPVDGETAVCRIPDLKGETAVTVKAERKGQKVIFSVEGELKDAAAEILLEDGRVVRTELKGARTTAEI